MPPRNIVLMGFMGTGKTTVGRLLSARLGWLYVDMDEVIEQRAGKSISRIFAENGEPAFRAMERELVKELAAQERQVIATGGGVPLNADNVRDFEATGLVVCLTALPEIIWRRVAAASHRPLLEQEDKRRRIEELLEKRRAVYAAIARQVDTSALTPEQVAERILGWFTAGAMTGCTGDGNQPH